MGSDTFYKTYDGSAEAFFERSRFSDGGMEHDLAWGKYLFDLYTKKGTTPITPEVAAAASSRDLECTVAYMYSEVIDSAESDVICKTISICICELTARDMQLEDPKGKM